MTPDEWSDRRKQQVGDLFDLIAGHPAPGMTNLEMMAAFGGVSLGFVTRRINDIRMVLGDDTINLINEPEPGARGHHFYRLTGDPNEARGWLVNRFDDLDTRLNTIHSISQSLVNATDARTIPGRRARLTETALRHLIEDLENLTT